MTENMNKIIEILTENNESVSVMESCTGGRICDEITNVEGASKVFKFGAVTYSDEYKIKFGVDAQKIERFSVYSMEVAREMSKNISEFSGADYGIGITGELNCSCEDGGEAKEAKINESSKSKGKTVKEKNVYISFYDKKGENFYDMCVKVNSPSRKENKEKIKQKVIEIMYKNINNREK